MPCTFVYRQGCEVVGRALEMYPLSPGSIGRAFLKLILRQVGPCIYMSDFHGYCIYNIKMLIYFPALKGVGGFRFW